MGLFGKSKEELELENKILKEMLLKQTKASSRSSAPPKKKQVLYQCRYCGYNSVRSATEGAPLQGVNNWPHHPRGTHKGPHSWMRTYL